MLGCRYAEYLDARKLEALVNTAAGQPLLVVPRESLALSDFAVDEATGILTYTGNYPFGNDVLDAVINGWRTVTPEVLRRSEGIVAKLPRAEMEAIQDRIARAAVQNGVDEELIQSAFPESAVSSIHHGVGVCVMQVGGEGERGGGRGARRACSSSCITDFLCFLRT